MEKTIKESERFVEKTVTYRGEVGEYDFVFFISKSAAELSICPKSYNPMRLGIVKCYPRSIADIEKFAAVSGDIFKAIATEARRAGLDDLRTEFERKMDGIEDKFNLERNQNQ